jgi:S-DNA-T family DNA segregation ATPase FtsK/SpoIIIE
MLSRVSVELGTANREHEAKTGFHGGMPVPFRGLSNCSEGILPSKKGRKKGGSGRLSELSSSFLLGEPLDEETAARVLELAGLLMVGLSIWLLLSLFSYHMPFEAAGSGHNLGGRVGFYLADWSLTFLGLSAYLLAVLGLTWGFVVVARKEVELPVIRVIGAFSFVFSFAFILHLGFGADVAEALNANAELDLVTSSAPYGPGGWLAHEWVPELVNRFGGLGLWVILVTLATISFMLATEMAFYPAYVAFADWVEEARDRRDESFGTAMWSWTKELFAGLWNFLRGADIDGQSVAQRATPKKKSPKKKPKKKPIVDEEEEYEDEEEEEDEELGEDEEWVYEDEEEEEDDEEDYDEYEDELEETEVIPKAPPKKTAKKPAKKTTKKPAAKKDEEKKSKLSATLAKVATAAVAKARKTTYAETPYNPPTPPTGPWTLPPMDLLIAPSVGAQMDREFLEESAQNLENALKSFRVDAEVVGAQVGPAVTMFELTVAQGTRMNRVTQLSQEIAATLRARSVRIIAPIPGKATIGIEVPNKDRRTVRMSELINQKAYDPKYMALPLFLGMDAEGKPVNVDLAKMPHLLIAGTTGSGKSVCINTIIASLLLTRSPHEVRLILVDPKMVELQMFQSVPHLELPVVTDMKQATNVLLWAVEKMEGRYELFKNAGVKNIKGYNALGETKLRERMGEEFNEERTPRLVPYIVLVIDEMADLMMQSKKEAEQAIARLAQKSRAVGVHVIVATQRPSTDVITGIIKGNLPTRIAFQVASKIDSRVILDVSGAEKLLGQGDMLYTPPGSSVPRRVQGALVEDSELQDIVDFITNESTQTFNQELVQSASGTAPAGSSNPGGDKIDELFNEAVTVVLTSKRGSASLLQRAMGIGYTRASRLVDQMTDAGILGDHRGSKSRELLMTLEDWEENLQNIADSGPV